MCRPVAAILNYMVRQGSSSGPFFKFSDGRFLTRKRFVKAVQSALEQANINSAQYAGHSFRIGAAATTAAHCGMQDSLIKTFGRWESSAYWCMFVHCARLCSVAMSLAIPAYSRQVRSIYCLYCYAHVAVHVSGSYNYEGKL